MNNWQGYRCQKCIVRESNITGRRGYFYCSTGHSRYVKLHIIKAAFGVVACLFELEKDASS